MKIVSLGQLPEEKQYKMECSYCHTVISVLRKECKIVSHRNETYINHPCPLCAKIITEEI